MLFNIRNYFLWDAKKIVGGQFVYFNTIILFPIIFHREKDYEHNLGNIYISWIKNYKDTVALLLWRS